MADKFLKISSLCLNHRIKYGIYCASYLDECSELDRVTKAFNI